jgi:hypothetical protein
MATKAQIKANRKNSQKSTGPRTAGGKAVTSKNAVKYGLFAKEVIIFGEDPADYDALHDAILAELAPKGVMEILLAERVVSLTWRLHRVERLMSEVINELIDKRLKDPFPEIADNLAKEMLGEQYPDVKLPYADGEKPDLSFGKAVIRDYANSRVIDKLSLYEKRIESSFFKTVRELERRKLMRQLELEEQASEQDMVKEPQALASHPQAATQQENELKKQSQSAGLGPEARSTKLEILNNTKCPENRNSQNKSAVSANSAVNEKRTQLPDDMDVTSFHKREYEDISHTEPNNKQSQIKADLKIPSVGSGINA